MLYRVEAAAHDPMTGQMVPHAVDVEAGSGDEAASRGRLAHAQALQRPFKIIAVYPSPEQPVPAAPDDSADPADTDGDGEVTKTELIAEAERRGIAVDKRWGVARLREALA